ncbi:MAG: cadmium-translocating P-type ATPase [Planctomycetes bacterium]|nr:cadmium-translocating P-type ATPase [Planctomycetota bacterium]
MDCPDEIAELRECLAVDGVDDLSFNLMQSSMTVEHDTARIDVDEIIRRVRTTGMRASVLEDSSTGPIDARAPSPRGPFWMAVTSAAAAAIGAALSLVPARMILHAPWPAAIAYTLAIAAAWRFVLPKAWSSLRRLRLDMNVLMTVAVIGAVGLGEWLEGAAVAVLFAISHLLETWSVNRARRAIQSLMELSPERARVLQEDGSERELAVEDVEVGNRIVIRPGEKFPLDGEVVEGETTVNQAPITGESAPVDKAPGDEVFAGTLNQDGAVTAMVTKAAGDTVLAGVIRLVEQAQSRRSRSEQFVETFARYYTPAVVIGAVLLCIVPPLFFGAAWSAWFYRALVLLVIACPCALVISTPVSVVSGLAAAARNGVLIKGGEFLEAVGRTRVIAIDKTGTLTHGKPVVQEVIPLGNATEQGLLKLAAAIEQRSEHSIARAIVKFANEREISPPPCHDYQAIRGKGAQATVDGTRHFLGNHRLLEEKNVCTDEIHRVMTEHEDCNHTVVGIASEERPLGVILLADGLRDEASEAIQSLLREGIVRVIMLTGDNTGTAEAIAKECGGIEPRGELLPADKVKAVEALRESHGHVLMVGDGINDAPALAAASVGIAMGAGGTDAALETADIALMTDDLRKLPWLLRHSRRTRRVIMQNIALSLGIKAVFLVLAVPGLANLWMAIAADMGASLLVTANGLRLLRSGFREGAALSTGIRPAFDGRRARG